MAFFSAIYFVSRLYITMLQKKELNELIRQLHQLTFSFNSRAVNAPEVMSESDTETLCEESISSYKPKLGKRGLLWKNKLFDSIASKTKIKRLRSLGWTDEEIIYEEPGYYYDDEYHGLASEAWFRRNKSCSDLSSAVGTAAGYSAWEYCGERSHTVE